MALIEGGIGGSCVFAVGLSKSKLWVGLYTPCCETQGTFTFRGKELEEGRGGKGAVLKGQGERLG